MASTLIYSLIAVLISVTATSVIQLILGIDYYLRSILFAIIIPLCVAPAFAYRFFSLYFELEATKKQLEYLSRTDTLTEVNNRRHLLEQSGAALNTIREQQKDIALLMLDLDEFKKVNDTYGHAAGDQTLATFAQIAKKVIRNQDLFGRFGGEEFMLLLPDTDLDQAISIANRICHEVASTPIITKGANIRITVSIGIVCTNAGKYSMDDLIYYADAALYQAKNLGRNRYHVAELPITGSIRIPQG